MTSALPNTEIAPVTELPDSVRIPLHSLQADLGYLIGRVIADGSCGPMIIKSMRDRLDQIEAYFRGVAQAARHPVAIENDQLRKTIQLHAGDAMSLSGELDEWRERALAAEEALSMAVEACARIADRSGDGAATDNGRIMATSIAGLIRGLSVPSADRACTCDPSERPEPCQKKYAFSECLRASVLAMTSTTRGDAT